MVAFRITVFISKLHIENYRCLRDVDVRFEPFTVLVGPNGSGKTALLDVLAPQFSLLPSDAWRHSAGALRRKVEGARSFDETIRFGVGHMSDQRWGYLKLHLSLEHMRSDRQVQLATQLASDGHNLVNVFATLPRRTQEAVAQRLCELVPLYADVNARPQAGAAGAHRLVFQDRWETKVWHEPSAVSDGTILLLGFLTLAHLDPAPDILAIEEPEHGLHPFLVGEVVGMLRDLADGKLGPALVQVVLATHSAELLEFVEPREVRFVTRSLQDGGTVVREAPIDTDEWKSAYAEYDESLGEMWLSGNVGGVPGAPPAR